MATPRPSRFVIGNPTPGRSYSLPIIALTAHALPEDRRRCLAAGMDDFLSKPFTMDDLQSILTHWVPETGASTITPEIVDDAVDQRRLTIRIDRAP